MIKVALMDITEPYIDALDTGHRDTVSTANSRVDGTGTVLAAVAQNIFRYVFRYSSERGRSREVAACCPFITIIHCHISL